MYLIKKLEGAEAHDELKQRIEEALGADIETRVAVVECWGSSFDEEEGGVFHECGVFDATGRLIMAYLIPGW